MWIGSWRRARGSRAVGVTLPAYIGAMLVAAVMRNLDDATGLIGLSQRTIDDLGNVALSLFLVLALMTLRLWELAGLALPMVAILVAQVALDRGRVLLADVPADGPRLRRRGDGRRPLRLHAGHDGQRDGEHGGAGRPLRPGAAAFLVVPMVGAFFIDFINAVIITLCLNIWT